MLRRSAAALAALRARSQPALAAALHSLAPAASPPSARRGGSPGGRHGAGCRCCGAARGFAADAKPEGKGEEAGGEEEGSGPTVPELLAKLSEQESALEEAAATVRFRGPASPRLAVLGPVASAAEGAGRVLGTSMRGAGGTRPWQTLLTRAP